MWKKIVFLFVILLLAGWGVFYWQNQKDVRELNKTLPAGVRVVKSLVGNNYKVVNKIDGYEFKVPKEWKGVKEIGYTPERTEMGYTGTSIELAEEKEWLGRSVEIDRFKSGGNMEDSLESWAESEFNTFGLVGDFTKDKLGQLDIVKTQENVHLMGDYVYFFEKNNSVYSITGGSEKFIREIISNGKW